MDGDGSTATASDANQNPAGTQGDGGAGDGAASVQPPADAFADERNKLTQQIRDFQSQRDRLQAELDKLKTPGNTPEPASAQPEALTAEGVMALLRREREMTSALSELKSEFTLADDAIFAGYDKFESVEALRAAAQSSHEKVQALVQQATQPAIEAALAPYIEKYGRLAGAPAESGGAPANGLPSISEVRNYTADQLDALVKQHGEDVIERIWRSSTTPTQ